MNTDHEIALMYASSPWGLFQPRNELYSPFSNVILRVVGPPRPSLEDMLLQFFTGDEIITRPTEPEPTQTPTQAEDETANSDDPTPNFDLSERLAREMQEQEDMEQEMRDRAIALKSQFGGFMSLFDTPGSTIEGLKGAIPRQQLNAEAGPSVVKELSPAFPSRLSSNPARSRLYQDQKMGENNESSSDDSDKISGKKPLRVPGFDITNRSPSELLDDLEAHLRYEINQFDFPEQPEFQPGSQTPVLLHTSSNAAVHSFEKVLLDVRANLGLVKAEDNDVVERRSQIDGRIQRELSDLDRKVLEAWAAKRRYSPVMDSRATL